MKFDRVGYCEDRQVLAYSIYHKGFSRDGGLYEHITSSIGKYRDN